MHRRTARLVGCRCWIYQLSTTSDGILADRLLVEQNRLEARDFASPESRELSREVQSIGSASSSGAAGVLVTVYLYALSSWEIRKGGRKPRRYGCAMACSLMDFIVSSPINQIIITTLVTITTSPSCWVSFSVFHRPSNSAVTLCVDAGIDRETRGGDNSLLKAFLSQINLRVLPSSFNCDTRLYECMA